jgi:large subunit ribosomal protein L30
MAAKKSEKKGGTLKVKLVRSVIGSTERQRQVVRGLGLRRINHTVEREDTPAIRGMVQKVLHLVEVTEG